MRRVPGGLDEDPGERTAYARRVGTLTRSARNRLTFRYEERADNAWEADRAWRAGRAGLAAYHRVMSVYAGHIARAIPKSEAARRRVRTDAMNERVSRMRSARAEHSDALPVG